MAIEESEGTKEAREEVENAQQHLKEEQADDAREEAGAREAAVDDPDADPAPPEDEAPKEDPPAEITVVQDVWDNILGTKE